MEGETKDTKKYKILIVDDDKFLSNMYTIKFQREGFEVFVANDGPSALGKITGEGLVPDVIMLDMIMPVMDGLEILEKIREDKLVPEAKIIFLTNQSQAVDVQKAKDLGINGYIIKATTIPSEVVAEVRKTLGGEIKTEDVLKKLPV